MQRKVNITLRYYPSVANTAVYQDMTIGQFVDAHHKGNPITAAFALWEIGDKLDAFQKENPNKYQVVFHVARSLVAPLLVVDENRFRMQCLATGQINSIGKTSPEPA